MCIYTCVKLHHFANYAPQLAALISAFVPAAPAKKIRGDSTVWAEASRLALIRTCLIFCLLSNPYDLTSSWY